MQIFHPDQKIKITPRRSKKFRVLYKWGIEICNVKYNHGIWIADLFKVNYISIGFKSKFGFESTKFFHGSNHRQIRLGFICVNWGFYTNIHKKLKYNKK